MKLRLTRRLVAVSVVSVVAVAVGATALAGHLADGVKSYTGCLVPNDGVIIKVKEGDAPKSACTAGQTQVHLSGGDITKISVTGALTGGGENGEVTIGLKPEFSLPQGCAAGQVAEWSGSAWNCGVDNDTTYTAGTGLDLSSGNEVSLEPAYRVKNTPDCSGGQFATGFDSGGGIVCAAPSAGSIATFQERQANFLAGDGIPDDGQWHTYVTLPVPAGTYFVTAKGSLDSSTTTSGSGHKMRSPAGSATSRASTRVSAGRTTSTSRTGSPSPASWPPRARPSRSSARRRVTSTSSRSGTGRSWR